MANLKDMKATQATLAAATAAAIEEIRAGRAQIIERRDALCALKAAPIPLREAEARVGEAVKAAGAAWLAEFGKRLFGVPVSGLASMGRGKIRRRSHALAEADVTGPAELPLAGKDAVCFGALAAGDPAAAERLVVGMLRAQYVGLTPGPSLAERPKRIAVLEAELAALEAADELRTDEGIALGLKVAVRPDVQRRRDAEAAAAKREAELAAGREARQKAIDQQHERERTA